MKRPLVVLALFLGCGGGSDPYEPPPARHPDPAVPVTPDYAAALQGNWIVVTGARCAFAMNFVGSGFSRNSGCLDSDETTFLMESDMGTFTADASKIYVTVDQSTCAGSAKRYYYSYGVSAVSLTITVPTEILALVRNTAVGSGVGGVAKLGCYDANGVFTPSPLAPL